ncbi:MAG: alanine--tRNA ligase, partial [Rickettsiales bacterium]|nr:alanine--tRNA ligase [Rickettsiales bacterium]
NKLSFTVYHTDDEAFNLWKKITGCDDSRILRIPTKDNFWAMGDTGPCGPCSEIFYDHGVGNGEWALNTDGSDKFDARFVEIWNLVFMQYEQVDANTRIDLPKPSIDTGMGLERISAVMQGVHDNYDIDLFKKVIGAIKDEAAALGAKPSADPAPYKVLADHLRSSCFLIADGVMPSNEGRGYVLRRIMRRAMRYAHQLGCKDPLMYKLVPSLVSEMGGQYPELARAQAAITDNLRQEEERFKQTLERGLKLLDEETAKLSKGGQLPGEAAFKLYDTYGFPLDLTQDILRQRGMTVDTDGFDTSMEGQRDMARAAHKGSGDAATERVIAPAKNSGAFEWEDVGRL